jgi:hypothetical protein
MNCHGLMDILDIYYDFKDIIKVQVNIIIIIKKIMHFIQKKIEKVEKNIKKDDIYNNKFKVLLNNETFFSFVLIIIIIKKKYIYIYTHKVVVPFSFIEKKLLFFFCKFNPFFILTLLKYD